ncbi:MAG: DNA polymerase III subunit gamma/tau [Deltaproteobacteria bacterium]|nr:DNA polymerase III subunit gamma/tau [Deltaproteobacteria bacterium]
MSSYLVLARKYRPKTFGDLIGQSQVSLTLTRAMEVGRLAHAYLFTGPRGVGKTTAARLLAMALSCSGTPPKPCGVCPSCLEIQNGQSVDVIEVDGASNRGINEIRSLRESVQYLPVKNPKKVYIIDEVHALTNDAFNALLKTLEEPPSHVVFIFATTEAQKLPATILSRCQRYDFRRIKVDDIVSRLTDVAKSENVLAQKDALTIIARQSEGGLRDALGLMDQVIASAGEITLSAVDNALGLINRDLIIRTVLSTLKGDLKDALGVLEEAYNLGYEFKELGLRSLELIRTLTLFKAAPTARDSLDLTDDELTRYKEITNDVALPTLHRHLESWLKFQGEMARHPQPRWLMESHLIRLCQMAPLAELGPLTARLLDFLESGGAPPAQDPGPPPRSQDTPLAKSAALAQSQAIARPIPQTPKPEPVAVEAPQPVAATPETPEPAPIAVETPEPVAATPLETSKPEPIADETPEPVAATSQTPEPIADEPPEPGTSEAPAPSDQEPTGHLEEPDLEEPQRETSLTQNSGPINPDPEERFDDGAYPEPEGEFGYPLPEEEPVRPTARKTGVGSGRDEVYDFLDADGIPDFAAMAANEGPLMPSRPEGVTMDEPPSAKENIDKLLELPDVKNLKALLPGKFTRYASFSPFELNRQNQEGAPESPEEIKDLTATQGDDEADFFESAGEEDWTD